MKGFQSNFKHIFSIIGRAMHRLGFEGLEFKGQGHRIHFPKKYCNVV